MNIEPIDRQLNMLRKQSQEISYSIIKIKVNCFSEIEITKKLYNLEIESSKIIEEINVLETQKRLIKRNRIF